MQISAPPPVINRIEPDQPLQGAGDKAALRATAEKFEAVFLAEMLAYIGLDASKGVAGAQPFSSFVNRAYAENLAARGGIGLTQAIMDNLVERHEAMAGDAKARG